MTKCDRCKTKDGHPLYSFGNKCEDCWVECITENDPKWMGDLIKLRKESEYPEDTRIKVIDPKMKAPKIRKRKKK